MVSCGKARVLESGSGKYVRLGVCVKVFRIPLPGIFFVFPLVQMFPEQNLFAALIPGIRPPMNKNAILCVPEPLEFFRNFTKIAHLNSLLSLSFHSSHRHAFQEVLLHREKQEDHRQRGNCGSGHHRYKINLSTFSTSEINLLFYRDSTICLYSIYNTLPAFCQPLFPFLFRAVTGQTAFCFPPATTQISS